MCIFMQTDRETHIGRREVSDKERHREKTGREKEGITYKRNKIDERERDRERG